MVYFKNKKSQFLILSALYLILLILFSYSLETQNDYITKNTKNLLLNNLIYETCQIGKLSNGSFIDSRLSNFSVDVNNYCDGFGYNCSLSIINNTQIPPGGNYSKLNYTHYNYSIFYEVDGFVYTGDFTC